ncbi:MAG: D-alanine--D-serine ligase VanG [Clostridiales bacterium]|nr:D-alanine--D-serine ligase VanG [Clostridiales bacterium]MDY4037600.1 D-alanine--D-serine ligase VanG [Candidatus Pseudoscilispira sp.]
MDKRTVAVLFGGCSSEYSVSLASAQAVVQHMDRERYTPVLIGISRSGAWLHYTGPVERMAEDTWNDPRWCAPAVVSLDRGDQTLLVRRGEQIERIHLDAAFPILHGKNGEDGTVQGVFELAGIPLVGCGVLASALCMDKDRAHKLAAVAGVNVPNSFVLRRGEAQEAASRAEALGYPIFVKPVKAGSSYGVTKVTERGQLAAAVELAFSHDDAVLLEECISGFEVGCAVLGNDVLTVGAVDEIELQSGFFDYTEKYTLKTAQIHVPARIRPEQSAQIQETARTVYRALGCRGFARVDLFLDAQGRIVFNEVNAIPGFTAHSRYPSMMKAAGLSLQEVLTAVIELAVEP